MFDLGDYVTIKIWVEYIIPVVVIVALFGILFIRAWIKDRKLQKKIDLLERNEYERHIASFRHSYGGSVGVPSYVWSKGRHKIYEEDLNSISYSDLERVIENVNKDEEGDSLYD